MINFSLVAGGGSVAYAVVKQQFLGIRFVARKSTLYGAATALFAVVYLTVVKPVSDFFGQYSLVSKEAFEATRERTDTIPIVAAGVVGEAMICLVLADELLIKFGGDRLDETLRNLEAFRAALREF